MRAYVLPIVIISIQAFEFFAMEFLYFFALFCGAFAAKKPNTAQTLGKVRYSAFLIFQVLHSPQRRSVNSILHTSMLSP